MKCSVVPFLAVTLRSTAAGAEADAGRVAGTIDVRGVFWPLPFSRKTNFGGASELGSAPWASTSLLQTLQLNSSFAVARDVLLAHHREGVRPLALDVELQVQRPAGLDVVDVLVPAQPVLDVAVGLELRTTCSP